MPTTQCKCGETINYASEHIGRMARCARCGQAVMLPVPPPPPKYKSLQQLNHEADRKRSIKLQLAALGLVIVCILVALAAFYWIQSQPYSPPPDPG
jgi:hypothetical protein